MNSWQFQRQIKHLLRSAKWTGSSNSVFHPASVIPTAKLPVDVFLNRVAPLCLIVPRGATPNPQRPGIKALDFEIQLYVRNEADGTGEATLLGASRAGQDKSAGRGVFEIEEEVMNVIKILQTVNGVTIHADAESESDAEIDDELGYIGYRGYSFQAYVTQNRTYEPPIKLLATDAGGGNASLTWDVPPDRYDRHRVILRRAAGATPPSGPTAGTGVTLASNLATSVTDTPGSGTFSYALFAAYDESNATPAQDDRFSAADTVTIALA